MRALIYLAAILMVSGLMRLTDPAHPASPDSPPIRPEPVPVEEYPVYDRVVQAKFLTSLTTLVIVNRLTVTRLIPDGQPLTRALFDEGRYFGGNLPRDLVTDFLLKSSRPWRLEAKFKFGVPVRFVSGDELEGPEVFLAPIPARLSGQRLAQVPPTTVGILEFSRVAFSPRGDQALVYVGDDREDGSGAGFLMWLRRIAQGWEILDTELLWVAKPDVPSAEER
jgi:hypothetical protein